MISIEYLKKSFGEVKAVNGLSFEIGDGSVVALLGPNGAGKTTTMRMLAQVFEPDSGKILFDGVPINQNPIAAKTYIGYLPENNPLDEDMLVAEYLELIADLRGLKSEKKEIAIRESVKKTGIESVYWRPIGELSKGYHQRVGLAQAILADPKVLILDEPTEGLDPNQRHEIRALIRDIGKERTVIISTHVLQEVEAMASRVIIISHGSLVSDSSVEELAHRGTKTVIHAEFAGNMDAQIIEKAIPESKVIRTQPTENGRTRFYIEAVGDIRSNIMALAKEKNVELWELARETVSLENVFRELTK
ncbi:MAG: ATP-binding cassette domain-containing protein [bacterium]|nr:ATP-binding cassette domain-containing protein [bacterium]